MTPITVVVDVLSAHFGGGGAVIVQQLRAIERTQPSVTLQVLAAPWNADALREQLRSPVTCVAVPDGVPRVMWEQAVLPWRARTADVLYCPGNVVPLGPCPVPRVLLVQNPNLFGAGRDLPANRRWYRRTRVALAQASARRAEHVVAVSRALRDDIAADVPRLGPRLVVVPCGAPPLPAPGEPPAGLGDPSAGFIVSIANDAPHKRLDDTVVGWSRAFAADPAAAPTLVLAGVIGPERRRHHTALVDPGLRGRLVHLGPVTDRREVAWLLHHARASVSSSALESFGLVTLEAGAVGCPLVLTDIPAHREVAGDRACVVPVGDLDALAGALRALDPEPVRTPWPWPVSWDDHAAQLADVFHRAAQAAATTTGHAR